MKRFLMIFMYFPSINFGIYKAEIFPWAILIASSRVRSFSFLELTIIGWLFFSSLHGMYVGQEYFEVFRSLGGYLIFFAAIFIARSMDIKSLNDTVRLNTIVFWFLLMLGSLQFFNLIPFLNSTLEFLVPRASSGALSDMGRGVTLLSTEPARAGIELIFIYFLYRLTLSNIKKKVFDVFILLFLVIVVQSAMAMLLYFLFLIFTYFRVALLVFIFSGAVTTLLVGSEGGGRSVELLRDLASSDIQSGLFLLFNTGGHRVFSLWSSYNYGLSNLFGGGVGAWKYSSIEAINLTGYDISMLRYFQVHGAGGAIPIRSSGIVSNMVLDLGYLFVSLFLWYLISLIKRVYKNTKQFSSAVPIILTFMIKILAIGSVGTPVEVFCFIVFIRYFELKSSNKINKDTVGGNEPIF